MKAVMAQMCYQSLWSSLIHQTHSATIILLCASATFQGAVAGLLVDRMLCVTDVGSTTGAADGVAIAPLVEPEVAIMLVAKSG